MIFQQLFEKDSSTYTYLIADPSSGQALLIDPVLDTFERDLAVLRNLNLTLVLSLETHIHADHLTSARLLKERLGCHIAYPAVEKPECADIGVVEGQPITLGQFQLHPLFTPGHTSHHHAYHFHNGMQHLLFTGDALLIEACGRTDFQSGNAGQLYDSIQEKFFSLPDETLVYPAHDYENRQISSIGQEKARNPRLKTGTSREQFIEIMNNLKLPYPRKIDFAVPGNQRCGQCPDNIPEQYRKPCDLYDQG